jgi:hypothetical protein
VAAAVRTLAGWLVRVRSGGRSKARARHTMRCRESLSQVSNIGRLGNEFCKAAWPAAAAFRSRKLHGEAPDFGRGRGSPRWARNSAAIWMIVHGAELGRSLEGGEVSSFVWRGAREMRKCAEEVRFV